jgi:hypothetical protein
MHLSAGSDLIDAGVDVGLPFAGALPDLGCFESVITGVNVPGFQGEIKCYPNPLHENGWLQFSLNTGGRCEIRLFDLSSRYVKILADQNLEPGVQTIGINMSDLRKGLYICRINLNNAPVLVIKLMKH